MAAFTPSMKRSVRDARRNDEWSLNQRYMQLEGLQTVSDTAPTRLPAVAR
jgi:hypothetical protein